MEEGKKFGNFIKTNLSIIVVIIIATFYIFWGSVELHLKELDWWELGCYIVTTLVFGISVANLVGESGFTSGKASDTYHSTRALLIEWCNALISYKEEATQYVDNQIDKEIYEQRKEILHRAGVLYEEIFNKEGKATISNDFFKVKGKYTKKQKKSVKQAIRLKKYEFTLFAYSQTKVIGRKKEQTENEFRAKTYGKDFITRVLLAIISGSIMFTFGGFTVASIIYAAFQMIMWVASGVMKRQKNYNFVVVTLREADLDRIGYLKAFAGSKGFKEKWEDEKLSLVITPKKEDNIVTPEI